MLDVVVLLIRWSFIFRLCRLNSDPPSHAFFGKLQWLTARLWQALVSSYDAPAGVLRRQWTQLEAYRTSKPSLKMVIIQSETILWETQCGALVVTSGVPVRSFWPHLPSRCQGFLALQEKCQKHLLRMRYLFSVHTSLV